MRERYFLLDTDIGSDIDDAMALLLCLRIKDFPLVAITTVYNCAKLRAKIAFKLLEKEGKRHDIPVGSGISSPIDELGQQIIWSSGEEGRGILSDAERQKPLTEFGIHEEGVKLMIDKAKEYAGELEILTVGQMTNLATAILRDKNFTKHVKRIWSMSAGVTYNQKIPEKFPRPEVEYLAVPSHNIRCDIEAADIVVKSGIPIVFVGNDVTTTVEFFKDDIGRVRDQGSDLNNAVMDLMEIWCAYRSRVFRTDITKTCLHDALVIAEALEKNFSKRIPIDIEIQKDMMGATVVKFNPDSKHEICWTVDSKEFEKWFIDIICSMR